MPDGYKTPGSGRPTPPDGRRKTFSLRLSPDLRERLRYWAQRDGVTTSQWIHDVVHNAVNDRDRDAYLEHLDRCE